MQKIKQKLFIVLCGIILAIPAKANAQYTLTPFGPPPEFTFQDLWHFTITGPVSSTNVEYYVALRIFNEQGSLLVKSNSDIFQIHNGVMYVNKMDLSQVDPFTTLYYSNLLQQVISNGDFFPAGTYNIVYNLMGRPLDGEFTELTEANLQAVVNVFMPPVLIHPEDGDTIDTPYPLLTWLPAYQASAGQTILYHIRLVEMFSGQTPTSALAANPTYFEQYDLPITAINYPPGANPIELDHTYAWTVAATIGGVPVAYAQQWQFTYALPKAIYPLIIDNKQYYTFFDQLSGSVVNIDQNSLRMRVEENYFNKEGYLSFKIWGNKKELVASSDELSIQLINGLRFIEIPFCGPDKIKLEDDKVYLVEISNIKSQKKYLRIRYKFDTNKCE